MKKLTLQELEQLENELFEAEYIRSSLYDPKGPYKFWVKPLVMDRDANGKIYIPCSAYVEIQVTGDSATVQGCCRLNDGVTIKDYLMEFDKLSDLEKKCVQLYYEKRN